jgi:hypothetical protein
MSDNNLYQNDTKRRPMSYPDDSSPRPESLMSDLSSIPDFLRVKAKPQSSPPEPQTHPPLPLLWALRLLVLADGTRLALAKRRHQLDELLQSLVPDLDVTELALTEINRLLKEHLAAFWPNEPMRSLTGK